MSREQQLAKAFVGLADTFSDDFDPLSLFHRLVVDCVELLSADASAVMMADARGGLRTMAASREEAAFLEMLQLHTGAGPCVECYRTGRELSIPDLSRERDRWPQLAVAALDVGFRSMYTAPLRLHDRVIGAVNLFRVREGELPKEDQEVAQALSDAAALALVHWTYEPITTEDIVGRVQGAITAKALFETAKGMIAEYAGVSISEASAMLRDHAVRHSTRLTDMAQALTGRALDPAVLLDGDRPG